MNNLSINLRTILILLAVLLVFSSVVMVGCYTPTTSLALIQKSGLTDQLPIAVTPDTAPIEIDPLTVKSLSRYGSLIRKYSDRYEIAKKHKYNPKQDIIIKDNVLEWAGASQEFRDEVENYFLQRKEDN